MPKKRIIILGAGLAGLSAAWHLQKKGIECLIFEKEPEVGGLCRSKNIGGFTFDYDGHTLHFKHHYTFNLVKGLLKTNLTEHLKSSWIYSHGRYTPYPFQANLFGLPAAIIKECLVGYIDALKNGHPKNNGNFLDWINKTFGTGIARHFMIPYNSKFWTTPPEEMTCDWLDGFVPVPSLNQVIDGTLKENKKPLGYNAHFWYPSKGGINQLPLALASDIKNIYTNCKITEINFSKKEIKISSGSKEKYDFLISTIPLPEIPYMVNDMPREILRLFKRLRWNSIFNLNLGIDKKDCLGRHWIYFPEKNISFFRLGFFNNFSSTLVPKDKSSMYIEVAYSKWSPIDKNKIVQSIMDDLKKIGVLDYGDRVIIEDINDIKYGYPIYDIHYNEARKKILEYLISKGMLSCGRYGSWRYFSMEDTIIAGKRDSDFILNNV